MDNSRGHEPGRREEDRRWLKMQETVMNLVTTLRTVQSDLAKAEKQVDKCADRVDDVDDYLRGGVGESLDTRMVLLEREEKAHGNELRAHGGLLRDLNKQMSDLKDDVNSLTLHKSINIDAESTRTDRLKVWLKFWGPIILSSLALIVPLARLAFDSLDKIQFFAGNVEYRPDERLRKQIEEDKKSQRARKVKKKLEALEKYQP